MGFVKQAMLWSRFLFLVLVFAYQLGGRLGKGLRLVHKRPEGEVAAAGAPQQLRRWRLSQSNRFVSKPSHS
jgi:hypothetical protein